METVNGTIGHIDRLFRRFGNWSTFERYWFSNCFVAHSADKKPYIGDWKQLNPPKLASPTDPSTWRDPSNVFGALVADKSGTLVGIGYVLHGDGTVCIDLDDAVDEHGQITPEAQQILDRFPNTYAEYSRSGRGIHIWLRTSKPLPADGRRKGKIEIYQDKRYIAITMDILPNRPQDMRDYTDELHDLYRELFGDDTNLPDPPNGGGEVYQPNDGDLSAQANASNMDDDQLIARFRGSKRKRDILWNGGQLSYNPTPSHADCSLAYQLMWYTKGDKQLARRLFCRSKRAHREKIHNRPDLIDRAINAAYRLYLHYRSQLNQQAQPVKSVKKNITQPAQRRSKVYTRNERVTEKDVFVNWFTNCVEINPDEMVPNSLAYQSYCDYVRRCGQKPYSAKKWAQLMAQKQIPLVRKMHNGQRTRYRVGIRLIQQTTTSAYKANKVATENDPFVKWFTKCVAIDPDGVVPNKLAYQHYCDYVRSIGQTPESMSKWARRMAQRGVPIKQKMLEGKRTRCRLGISLVQPSG